jgi:hypothetical protein
MILMMSIVDLDRLVLPVVHAVNAGDGVSGVIGYRRKLSFLCT